MGTRKEKLYFDVRVKRAVSWGFGDKLHVYHYYMLNILHYINIYII